MRSRTFYLLAGALAVLFFGFLALMLTACGGQSIEEGVVGKWVASGTDEAFNTYEFFADGTGFLSTPDGSISVDFTWSMADEGTMLFNVNDNGEVRVVVAMPDKNRLTFQPETTDEVINLRRAEE